MDRDTDTDAGLPNRLVVPAQRSAADPFASGPVDAHPAGSHRLKPSPFDLPAQRLPVRRAPRFAVDNTVDNAVDSTVDPALVRDSARSDVLHRHARLTKNGRPVFCTPSRDELDGVVSLRQSRGTDGKVIYSTREAAEAAARELEDLGARALRSYRCGRSRSGHFHLTTDSSLHARIPRQRAIPA